jgi:hypothetical protein
MIKSHSEHILPINGGGLRSLLQEFEQSMNRIWNVRINKIKVVKNSNGINGNKYGTMKDSLY